MREIDCSSALKLLMHSAFRSLSLSSLTISGDRETLGCCQLCGTSGELIMHAWVDLCLACFGIGKLCNNAHPWQPTGFGQDAVAD